MNKSFVLLLIVGFLILIAIFTNPTQDAHKQALKTKLMVYMQKKLSDSSIDEKDKLPELGQMFGVMIGNRIADEMIDNLVSTDNYLVLSTTKITWEGQSKVIGWGMFGNVFIPSQIEEKIDAKLKQALSN